MHRIVLPANHLQIIVIYFLKCVGNSVQKDSMLTLQLINVKSALYSSAVKHVYMMQQILCLIVLLVSTTRFSIYLVDNAFLLAFQHSIKINGTIAVVIVIHRA